MNILKRMIVCFRNYELRKQLVKIKHAKKPALLIGAPLYWNVGDLAIAEAEHIFFDKYYHEYELIDIPRELWLDNKLSITKLIDDSCPIFITGGGFLGDLWPIEQKFIEDVLISFSKNTIIFFPQTIFFEDHNKQANFLKILSAGKQILLILRERQSYFEWKKYENANIKVMLVPDIVLSLENNHTSKRKKCVLCFRNDKEKILDDLDKKNIDGFISSNGLVCQEYSTVYPKYVSLRNRKGKIDETLRVFSEARFVITDRLHGLILATISGTPVLFFDNITKKVSLTAEFLSDIENVINSKNYDCVETALKVLKSKKEYPYSRKYLNDYYMEMRKVIDSYLNRNSFIRKQHSNMRGSMNGLKGKDIMTFMNDSS